MQSIYEPKGAAREYAPLALNLYRGCEHGCTYCYAPLCLHMTRENFSNVSARAGIIDTLEKDLKKFVPKQTVLLSFTSDPYQPIERTLRLTRSALEVMDGVVPSVAILTKNTIVCDDFDIIARNCWYVGTTLSCYSPEYAKQYEPYAPLPAERIKMLEMAENAGIDTFVSVEPVLSEAELELLLQKIKHLKIRNGVRIGKWNHNAEANKINWKSVLDTAISYANSGKPVYIKDELAKFGNVPTNLRRKFFG
jgi:DNA repair photolyase